MRSDARKRLDGLDEIAFRNVQIGREPGSLVGVIGKKRAGKDSFAATLVEERGYRRFAFADRMKDFALALDPIVGRWYLDDSPARLSEVVERQGWERAKEIEEVRRTLQRLGTNAGREVLGEDVWVAPMMREALAHPGPVVITDVRFPNECEAILAAGGLIVRITRPGLDSDDSHESENALNGYPADLDVLNAGTLGMLAETVRSLTF
jgi:hypothetical protein